MELAYGDHWVVELQRQHVRPPMNTMIIARMSSSWCQICYSALWVPSIASSEWMLRHGSVVGSQYILFQILRFTTYLLYNRRCMKSLQYITRMRIPWLSSDSCLSIRNTGVLVLNLGMYGWDWIFVSEISMTFMNAIYGRIKTFRWKGLVWLIIEDEGVYEMVADEKGYLK